MAPKAPSGPPLPHLWPQIKGVKRDGSGGEVLESARSGGGAGSAVAESSRTRVPRRGFAAKEGVIAAEEGSILRGKALKRWYDLLKEAQEGTRTGGWIAEAGNEEGAIKILDDVFAKKSTSTLNNRAGALGLYKVWAQTRGSGGPKWLPIAEQEAYDYLSFLKGSGAPATRADRFRQALAFLVHVVGAQGMGDTLSSQRVAGVAWHSFCKKRWTVQRSPFTVLQVRVLEEAVMNDPDPQINLVAGHIRFCIAARLRHSDAQRVVDEPFLDLNSDRTDGYIEAKGGDSKTASANKKRKKRWFPAVGHCFGLNGGNWGEVWLQRRSQAGFNVAVDGCLTRAPMVGGGFARRPLRSDEMAVWAAAILQRGGAAVLDGQAWGSHSARVTLLSWAAKFGLRNQVRRVLGGHAKPKDTSVLEYSRDAVAMAMRKLRKVELQIVSGAFRPDETRSGRFAKAPRSSSSSSASSSSSSSSSSRVAHQSLVAKDERVLCAGDTGDADIVPGDPVGTGSVEGHTFEQVQEVNEESGSEHGSKAGTESAHSSSEVSSTEQESEDDEVQNNIQALEVVFRPKPCTAVLRRHWSRGTIHKQRCKDHSRLECGRAVDTGDFTVYVLMSGGEPPYGEYCATCFPPS